VVDALEDAGRVGDDRVGVGAAQVGGGEPLQQPVGDAGRRGQRDAERGRVGDAGAVGVGRRHAGGVGQLADLLAGPVDQGDADPQAAQQRDVEQQVAEVVVLDDAAVQRDDEQSVAEPRDVAEDFTQVGQAEHRRQLWDRKPDGATVAVARYSNP
jgi:hypothetical protein